MTPVPPPPSVKESRQLSASECRASRCGKGISFYHRLRFVNLAASARCTPLSLVTHNRTYRCGTELRNSVQRDCGQESGDRIYSPQLSTYNPVPSLSLCRCLVATRLNNVTPLPRTHRCTHCDDVEPNPRVSVSPAPTPRTPLLIASNNRRENCSPPQRKHTYPIAAEDATAVPRKSVASRSLGHRHPLLITRNYTSRCSAGTGSPNSWPRSVIVRPALRSGARCPS